MVVPVVDFVAEVFFGMITRKQSDKLYDMYILCMLHKIYLCFFSYHI